MSMDEGVVISNDLYREPVIDDRYVGIRALWIKVIIRAIYDWVTYRDSTKLQQIKRAEGAEIWIFRPSELFNSFESACHYVGLDPDRVRTRIRSMSREDVGKIEYLERVTAESGTPIGLVTGFTRTFEAEDAED
jgi:glutamate/tyrosine decarboxylase-like PLP-dependent enzyme